MKQTTYFNLLVITVVLSKFSFNKFLETKGIKSFLEKANISEARGMGLTHNRALAHA